MSSLKKVVKTPLCSAVCSVSIEPTKGMASSGQPVKRRLKSRLAAEIRPGLEQEAAELFDAEDDDRAESMAFQS